MNCDLMVQYIKFVADRLLLELECPKVRLSSLCIIYYFYVQNLVVTDLLSFIFMHRFKTEVSLLFVFGSSFLILLCFLSSHCFFLFGICLSLSYLPSFSVLMLPFSSLRPSYNLIAAFLYSHCCLSSVADPGSGMGFFSVPQCCGSGMFIPDPGS
jgi:hypothetical protein